MPLDYWDIQKVNTGKILTFVNAFIAINLLITDILSGLLSQLETWEFIFYCLSMIIITILSPLAWQKKNTSMIWGTRIIVWLALINVSLLTFKAPIYFLYFIQLINTLWHKNLKECMFFTFILSIAYVSTFIINPHLRKDIMDWGVIGILMNFLFSYLLYKQNENEKKHKQLSKIFKMMLNTTNNGVQFINANGQTCILNPAAEVIYGRTEEEIQGKLDWELYYSGKKYDEDGKYTSLITESLETGKINKDIEKTFIDDFGNRKTYLIETFRVFDDEEGEVIGALGIYRDITEQKETERQLLDAHYEMANMAVTDELTKLYNMRYFRQRLTTEIAKAFKSNLSLLIIDVDYFKIYNDLYGHPEGDKVLQKIGQILKESFRESDIVARYGGEEFTVILPDMKKEKAKEVAERIRLKIKDTSFKGEEKLPGGKLTVTIGIASIPEDAKTAEELIKIADDALYKGKFTTRDIVVTLDNTGIKSS
ncbi:MAG: hypothetical protein PWQ67_1086 [Clostridia bacterium]|jgi:diguanylate cyclase (GGDEF)-like protein/PAS domain S-box-containing protein|nr:hypothetical protein [Clostridia bacterium]MDN5322632.1 hypothetical protein [Clostridia bacterium]